MSAGREGGLVSWCLPPSQLVLEPVLAEAAAPARVGFGSWQTSGEGYCAGRMQDRKYTAQARKYRNTSTGQKIHT